MAERVGGAKHVNVKQLSLIHSQAYTTDSKEWTKAVGLSSECFIKRLWFGAGYGDEFSVNQICRSDRDLR